MAMLDAKCTINLILDIIDDTRNELMIKTYNWSDIAEYR